MAVMEAGTAAHRRAVAELEAGLGPFADPDWRADLALLDGSWRSASVQYALDCRTISRLAARVPRNPQDDRGGTPWTSFLREIAVARKISDRAAHGEVELALALVARHPRTLRALEAGQAPVHRARTLVEACALHTDEVAAAADDALADRLDQLTPARVGHEVDRIALRLDADAAARKEAAATAGRAAAKRALPHGQAEITLTGPAAAVQAYWQALTDRARALKAAGDPRSLGALRFDLAITADPSTSTGASPLLTLLTGRPGRPHTGGPATPGQGGAGQGGAGQGGAGPADGPADNPAADAPAWPEDGRFSRPVQAQITVPAATALGLSEEPGWLDGHGWLSAPTCRQLLTVAELVKACIAPHTGQLVDLADRPVRPRLDPTSLREAIRQMVLTAHRLRETVTDPQLQHDPNPALRAFVQARDRFCDGPTGTQVPARNTDTDHHRPWPSGPTAAWNLASRAPRTHQLKHRGWTATRDGTGTTWTSPAGQIVHAPAHHHPPEPLPPDSGLSDPEELAARDAALLRAPSWPDPDPDTDPRPAGPPDPDPADLADDEPEADGSARAAPATTANPGATTANGWPDDPPF